MEEKRIPLFEDFLHKFLSYQPETAQNEFPWPWAQTWNWLWIDHRPQFILIAFFILLALLGLIIFAYSEPLARHHKKIREKYLFKWAAFLIWIAGVILYIVGFCHEGTKDSPLALLLRSSLSSLEMFVSHSDLIEVSHYWKNEPVYMTLFATVHFLAVALSAMFAIRYIGFRVFSWLKLKTWTLFHRRYTLYVFFDISEASCLLAKDIKEKKKTIDPHPAAKIQGSRSEPSEPSEPSESTQSSSSSESFGSPQASGLSPRQPAKKPRQPFWRSLFKARKAPEETQLIIFVDSPVTEEEPQQRLSFSHIFGLFSYRRAVVEKVSALHAHFFPSSAPLSESTLTGAPLLVSAGLGYLAKLIWKASEANLFFLSADEDTNVKSVIHLLNGPKIKEKNLKIFCHARKDSCNSLLENASPSYAEVRVIDSSWLSIVALKTQVEDDTLPPVRRTYKNHPINFVTCDPCRGVATTPFTALIVGFGQTGRDALRFLYEFGHFPTGEEVEKGFECYVCDKKMTSIKGRFLMQTPALAGNETVKLFNLSSDSPSFWQQMETLINRLNYVVIAVGDDEKGISLAVDLYNFAHRHSVLPENDEAPTRIQADSSGKYPLRIFVRSYKQENEVRLRHIAGHFSDTICLFGASSALYTRRLIIDDDLLQTALKYYNAYYKLHPSSGEWEERHKTKEEGRWIRQNVKRKEAQDIANCLHCYTKIRLGGGAGKMCTLASQEACYASLVVSEHLRWMASHEMLGYRLMTEEVKRKMEDKYKGKDKPTCHEPTKQHLCMVPDHALSQEHHDNDRAVVNTTIALLKSLGQSQATRQKNTRRQPKNRVGEN